MIKWTENEWEKAVKTQTKALYRIDHQKILRNSDHNHFKIL